MSRVKPFPLPYLQVKKLIYAVVTGNLEEVKKNVPKEVNVNQPITPYLGAGESTYLSFLAIEHDRSSILEYLIEVGFDMFLKDKLGMNAFCKVASMPHASKALTDVLFNKRWSHLCGLLNDQNNAGNTPAHLAVNNLYTLDVMLKMTDNLKIATIRNNRGDTPLAIAIKRGNSTAATMLVKYAKKVSHEPFSTTDKTGYTALELANMYRLPSVGEEITTSNECNGELYKIIENLQNRVMQCQVEVIGTRDECKKEVGKIYELMSTTNKDVQMDERIVDTALKEKIEFKNAYLNSQESNLTLKKELFKVRRDMEAIETRLEIAMKSKTDLETTLVQTNQTISDLEIKLAKVNQEKTEADKICDDKIKSMQNKNLDAIEMIRKLNGKVHDLKSEILNLEEDIADQENHIKEIQVKKSVCNTDAKSRSRDQDKAKLLETIKENKEACVEKLKTRLEKTKVELEKHKTETENRLREQEKKHADKVNYLETRLKTRLEKGKVELEKHKTETENRLREQEEKHADKVNHLETRLKDKEDYILSLKGRLEMCVLETEKLNGIIDGLTDKIGDKDEISKQQVQAAIIKHKEEDMEDEIDKRTREIKSKHQEQLTIATETIKNLRNLIEKMKIDCKKTDDKQRELLTTASETNEYLKKRIEKMEDEIDKRTREIKSKHQEQLTNEKETNNNLKKRIEEMEDEMDKRTREIKSKHQERLTKEKEKNDNLKKRMEEMEDEIDKRFIEIKSKRQEQLTKEKETNDNLKKRIEKMEIDSKKTDVKRQEQLTKEKETNDNLKKRIEKMEIDSKKTDVKHQEQLTNEIETNKTLRNLIEKEQEEKHADEVNRLQTRLKDKENHISSLKRRFETCVLETQKLNSVIDVLTDKIDAKDKFCKQAQADNIKYKENISNLEAHYIGFSEKQKKDMEAIKQDHATTKEILNQKHTEEISALNKSFEAKIATMSNKSKVLLENKRLERQIGDMEDEIDKRTREIESKHQEQLTNELETNRTLKKRIEKMEIEHQKQLTNEIETSRNLKERIEEMERDSKKMETKEQRANELETNGILKNRIEKMEIDYENMKTKHQNVVTSATETINYLKDRIKKMEKDYSVMENKHQERLTNEIETNRDLQKRIEKMEIDFKKMETKRPGGEEKEIDNLANMLENLTPFSRSDSVGGAQGSIN